MSVRVQFDGVDDAVTFGNALNKTESDAFFLQATIYTDTSSAGQIIGKRQGGATAIGYVLRINPSGQLQFIFQSSTSANRILVTTVNSFNDLEVHVVRVDYDGSGLAAGVTITVDDVSEALTVGTDNLGSVPAISNPLAVGSNGTTADFFEGVIYDISFNGETAAQGYGNTDPDWVDIIGSNNGTVVGNPTTIPWIDPIDLEPNAQFNCHAAAEYTFNMPEGASDIEPTGARNIRDTTIAVTFVAQSGEFFWDSEKQIQSPSLGFEIPPQRAACFVYREGKGWVLDGPVVQPVVWKKDADGNTFPPRDGQPGPAIAEVPPNTMTLTDRFLMISNKATTQHPSPYLRKDPEFVSEIPGVPTPVVETANELIYRTGNNFFWDEGGLLQGFRFYIPDVSGSFNYSFSSNIDGQVEQLWSGDGTGATVGWQELVRYQIILPGSRVELTMIVRPVTLPNTFSALWDVKNTNSNPGSGEAAFRNSQIEIRVHNTDKNDVNQAANLNAITAGGTLSFAGQTWTITSITNTGTGAGDRHNFFLDPAQGRPTEGEYTLQFDWGSTQPLPYMRVSNHYVAFSEILGFESADLDGPVVYNSNLYGVDWIIDDLIVPTDWDVMSISAIR